MMIQHPKMFSPKRTRRLRSSALQWSMFVLLSMSITMGLLWLLMLVARMETVPFP